MTHPDDSVSGRPYSPPPWLHDVDVPVPSYPGRARAGYDGPNNLSWPGPPVQGVDGSFSHLPPPVISGGDGGGGHRRRSWFARHKILTAVLCVAALLAVFGVIAAIAGPAPAKQAAVPVSAPVVTPRAPAAKPSPAAKPAATKPAPKPKPVPVVPSIAGTGTFLVGSEIAPGTYRTPGPDAANRGLGVGCYWERLSGTSGDFGDIIANGNPEGPAVVTIRRGDKAFTSDGCEKWTLVR